MGVEYETLSVRIYTWIWLSQVRETYVNHSLINLTYLRRIILQIVSVKAGGRGYILTFFF